MIQCKKEGDQFLQGLHVEEEISLVVGSYKYPNAFYNIWSREDIDQKHPRLRVHLVTEGKHRKEITFQNANISYRGRKGKTERGIL